MVVRVREFQDADIQYAGFTDIFVSPPAVGSEETEIAPVTLTVNGAVALNATTINLDPALTQEILRGTELRFGTTDVIVAADAPSGGAVLNVEPVISAIVDNATATYSGLVPIFSLQSANDSIQTDTIEDQVFRSGGWKVRRTTGGSFELQCSGIVVKNDPGLKYVKEAARAFKKLFVKLVSELGDDEISGWAFPMNFSVSRENKQYQKVSFNLQFTGKPNFDISGS